MNRTAKKYASFVLLLLTAVVMLFGTLSPAYASEYKKIEDLNGKKVAVKPGTNGSDYAKSIKDQYGFDIVEFKEVRGPEVVREAEYTVGGVTVKVAVTSGLGNARALLEKIKKGEADYQMVEVMACPGGCINGGGQPIQSDSVKNYVDLKGLRSKALYTYDANNSIRRSHESPVIKMLYDEYFEEPGAHKAHELLHTTYVPRSKF